jgi:hypothetical protein
MALDLKEHGTGRAVSSGNDVASCFTQLARMVYEE